MIVADFSMVFMRFANLDMGHPRTWTWKTGKISNQFSYY